MLGVPIDVLYRLLGSIDTHRGRAGQLSSAVDDPGFENARAEFLAIVEAGDALRETVEIVCHVARAGHAIGEIERAIDVVEMLVVVPKSRHEETALRVDDLGISGWFRIRVGSDARNPIAANDDACAGRDAEIARVEQPGVAENELSLWLVGQLARNAFRPGGV